jgi:putative salt-induced outer membrane protein YdiY
MWWGATEDFFASGSSEMRRYRVARVGITLFLSLAAFTADPEDAHGQQKDQAKGKDEPKLGWSNDADLSLVVTEGNSDSATLGFSDQLRYVWNRGRFEFEVNMVRTDKADDRFFLVEPGLEFPVGAAPARPAASLITPEPEPDVANYLIRTAFERNIATRWFWNTGASWYRNEDAGIRNRYIFFGGVGNTWADNQRRRFVTSYGISYTDRQKKGPDPESGRRFTGPRAGWDYIERFNAATTFHSDLGMNANFSDRADYSINTLNSLTVSVNNHVSLKASVQWLFENEPALESDLDVVAYVELLNPDGIPGTGDERFRTLSSGGTKFVLGSSVARREKLDTVVRTALVISFARK